jgi:hypothetical protein
MEGIGEGLGGFGADVGWMRKERRGSGSGSGSGSGIALDL